MSRRLYEFRAAPARYPSGSPAASAIRAVVTYTLADLIRFRLLMIGAGYDDGNEASALGSGPMFKMAQGLAPSERRSAQSWKELLVDLMRRRHGDGGRDRRR